MKLHVYLKAEKKKRYITYYLTYYYSTYTTCVRRGGGLGGGLASYIIYPKNITII
jgi:hypothetical protein